MVAGVLLEVLLNYITLKDRLHRKVFFSEVLFVAAGIRLKK